MSQAKPFPIGVNYFSIVLGISALGLAWRYSANVLAVPTLIAETLIGFAALLWGILFSIYVYKWIRYPIQAKAELHHPILGCFVSLIPITLLLIAMGLSPYSKGLAQYLVGLGIVAQLAFSTYRYGGLWRGIHPQDATTPVLYLPTVAANFVSATALGLLGYSELGMLFFGAGVIAWIILEPAVQQRLRNLTELPTAIRPTIGIQLAPAFVCCSAYLALNGGHIDWIVKSLIGYGLLQLLFLIRLLPWIGKQFRLTYWAFSFGLASMAGVGIRLYGKGENLSLALQHLGLTMFIVASLCIGFLIVATLRLVITKQIP
ncbi:MULTISPECIES: dicarboxylate transporter/tellurite-resistance protein TehA [unclassified Avibacterium]|uniref:dicarboxylate transporter/tellurite-resistance protein TehA n=1 Tax=unclassified Avibacterium TaxID=2685287 RepID=UPI00202609F0|nr:MULTISPECIES: dicarboxylate transporter/tellurite-resistance protein TehA [unclassified Avibacterium]MCW9699006.1 dicarboxylate transporter/tellurite-resistance protein TehA [Avibacterium sp. 20-129]URL06794.1 dicarboxylate transporter/tellurite-resistance protein TehA [Avibacterium sp. 21-595]